MADSGGSCKEKFGSACKGLPTDDKRAGNLYCVLHSPRVNKDLAAFEGAIEKKLRDKDFDFRGIYFPSKQSLASFLPNATFEGTADFSNATFKEQADFSSITFEKDVSFSKATFDGEANFYKATFKVPWLNFSGATFNESAYFHKATFKVPWVVFTEATFEGEADFSEVTFEGNAHFDRTTFEGMALFFEATFEGEADFSRVTFKGEGVFWALQTFPQTRLRFAAAVIQEPERFSFHSTHLRPNWFVDVDAQKFDFSDVEWFRLPDGDELKLEKEIEALEVYGEVPIPTRLRKLQKACRKLMDNAEENRDYPTSNEFHYWSMVLARKEAMVLAREKSLREGLRRFGMIDALYGALSGYGDRPWRAFLVLAGMWTLFAILYVMVAGSIEHVGQAFLYSLAAIVRLTGVPAMAPLTKLLQSSEPGVLQLLVTVEGILGPLQIALLALAIRRQVMR